jgi:hypothetical protein
MSQQQRMVDRHYSLNLKQWSARTLYVYTHVEFSTKTLRWSTGNFCLQVVLPGRKFFFPALFTKYLLYKKSDIENNGSCMRVFIEKDDPYWQGWIYRGGGCTGMRTPVGIGQQGCKGGAKNPIQK